MFSVPFDMLVLCFFLLSFSVDCNVIHIDREPSLCHLLSEYHVHHHLEGGRQVCEAKKHYCWFEQSFWHEEGCLPLVSFLNANIVVSPTYVKLGEEGISAKAINSLWD
jgi:hypothetical protein